MATRRSPPRDKSSADQRMGGSSLRPSTRQLWGLSSFLFGTLLVWSFLSPVDATSVFTGAAIPQNLFWLVLAAATSVVAVTSGRHYRFGIRSWLMACLCLTWLIAVAVWAGRENNPRIAWNGFWQVVALAACFYSARALLAGPLARAAGLHILLVAGIAMASHGLHQEFISFPNDRARYRADPDEVLSSIGIDAPAGSPERKRFEDRLLESSEPYATFALANSLATVLTGELLLLLGLFAQFIRLNPRNDDDQRRPNFGLVPLVALVLAAALVLVCWFLTLSRAAFVALPVGIGYWLWISRTKWKLNRRVLPWAVGVAAIGLAAGAVWLMRNDRLVLSEAPKSLAYRLEYWLATAKMLQDHWLFGVGLGNFQSYYPQYKLATASEAVADPHNWILDICATLSVPVGLVVFCWIARQLIPQKLGDPGDSVRRELGNSVRREPGDCDDRLIARYMIMGGVGGGTLCAGLMSLLSGVELSVAALTWIPAALLGFLLQPVVKALVSHVQTLALGAAVAILTCLLANGSWQASGIAVPLLILLVLGQPESSAGDRTQYSARQSWTLCALPALGLILFIVQCWRPTTKSWAWMQQAIVANEPEERLALAERAAEADPLDAEPIRWTAQMLASQATLAPADRFSNLSQKSIARFEHWLSRDAIKPSNWELAAKHVLELAAIAENRGLDHGPLLEQSIRYYKVGMSRYPSNVGYHAQLAATLAIGQHWEECLRELQLAIRLSDQTPHLDKKLAGQLLWLPMLPAGAESRFGDQLPWVPAEPMVNWLRSEILDNTDSKQ